MLLADVVARQGRYEEAEPLIQLAKDQQLSAYEHSGFWQSMDTLRDKNHLEQLWQSGEAPWKQWD